MIKWELLTDEVLLSFLLVKVLIFDKIALGWMNRYICYNQESACNIFSLFPHFSSLFSNSYIGNKVIGNSNE